MKKIKSIEKSRINKIYKYPESSGLAFKIYGKSQNINDYSEMEINEMILGIYKKKKFLG